QRANIQHVNGGKEMYIPQQGHLAAQRADGLGFQPLIGQEQEQSEDEPVQDQGQPDLINLPDNPQNEGQPEPLQETRRSQANKGCNKPRLKSSNNKSRQQRYLRLWTALADISTKTLSVGATTRYSSQEKLNLKRLYQTIAHYPFQGNQIEMQAYKAILLEELQEGIIEEIPKEQVKWWNPTFLVPKPSRGWGKILNATFLNEEIHPLHFQMIEVEQV
ncbi:MAG: hypothetical protein EZS28_027578, partial [Streblomastix strix]